MASRYSTESSLFVAWLRKRGSMLVALVGGALIVGLVVTVAVVSTGYTAQRVELTDGSVWVANGSKQAIGRANPAVGELNSVVLTTGSSALQVVQHGKEVLLYDSSNSTVDIIDTSTSSVERSVPVPPDDTAIYTTDGQGDGSGRAVIHARSTGNVWILPLSALDSFDAQSAPALNLGADSISSMESDGTFFAFSPGTGELFRVDADTGDVVTQTVQLDVPAADDYAITSTGGVWALLDESTRTLYTGDRIIDLTPFLTVTDRPVLQAPVTAEEAGAEGTESIFLGSSAGLLSIPLTGKDPELVLPRSASTGQVPIAAQPLVRNGCAYAAWTDGSVWTRCLRGMAPTGEGGRTSTVPGMPANAVLTFAANGDQVVLNDVRSGGTWDVQSGNALIDNWDQLLAQATDSEVVTDTSDDSPPVYEKTQQAPVAVDDDLGARPGRSSVLPVLLNDYDANGDVLVLSELTGIPADQGSLAVVSDGQQVLLTLDPAAKGQLSFGYSITDGRGESASATVTVTVRAANDNSAPVQARRNVATVAAGGRVTTSVLAEWFDPDGDALFLTSASVAAPDTVSYKPGGDVVLVDAGATSDTKDVALVVSDGRLDGAGTLAVAVKDAGEVPIIAEAFIVQAYADQEVEVSPLVHVRGGTGTIRLTNVPDKVDVTIEPDYDGGTFRVRSSVVGTHYLDYTVSDGSVTATGLLRVEVAAPPDPNGTPIAVQHTAFVREQSTANLDVLATDVDPAGGVLLVTSVDDISADTGVRVEVLEQRLLRITLTRPLDDGSVSFHYTLTNGLADAVGTVTVVQIPQPDRTQPPIAAPDQISVRVSDTVDIPVLANDEQPDGEELSLDPTLVDALPSGAGLLFASQNRLRYLAPDVPGNYTAVYRVNGPDGQWATAQVSIAVREADEASNNPPVPPTITARVLAGQTVRIPIDLSGIDPDGDSVQLLGQQSNPEKGAVTEIGADWLAYEAGEFSAGTDTFSYRVVDALGAVANGTVRVGVSARADGVRNPIAVPDEVTVQPGRSVSVQVLANDSDPDGAALSIIDLEATTEGADGRIDGEVVTVSAPTTPGRYGFVYTIENETGAVSSNFITVLVAQDAPLARPVVSDTVLGLSDILGRQSVDVRVLDGVFFAEGSSRLLDLSLVPGYADTAEVTGGKRIRVALQATAQIIPFRVSHPDDASVSATGFIRVPGFNDALPQLRKDAPRLTVASGGAVTIDLKDYVVAVGNGNVRLTDSSTVRATHSDGSSLVVDASTLRFSSARDYFGPASISFEVTDGTSATDPNGRVATLVLPITVEPRENQPPTFDGGILEVEPGSTRTIDLTKLTSYPYANDLDQLAYLLTGPQPDGFTLSLTGQRLKISVDPTAAVGSVGTVLVGVSDDVKEGEAGRIELHVVASTKPLASPAPDVAIARRGTTTVLDVLANDQATNPFPGQPLRVGAVRGADDSQADGIQITPSTDRASLTIRVSDSAAPQDVTLQYEVLDATGELARAAWGTVTVSVQDAPDAVSNLHATAFADRAITVTFNPGAANNSPILGYDISTYDTDGDRIGTTTCQSTTCTVRTPGNGSSNEVQIGVVGRNAVGSSAEVRLPEGVWSDVVPGAPVGLSSRALDHGLRIFWSKPAETGGSAITYYLVTVAGFTGTLTVPSDDPVGTSYSLDVSHPAIGNGAAVAYSVSARNSSFGGLTSWNSAGGSGTPAGDPIAIGAPSASVVDSGGGNGTVTVNWAGSFDGNGAGIGQYFAAMYTGSPPSCRATDDGARGTSLSVPAPSATFQHVGTATTATFSVPTNERFTFVVFAYNGQGCSSSGEVTAVTRKAPSAPSTVDVSGPYASGSTTFSERLDNVSYATGGGSPTVAYFYRVGGDATAYSTSLGALLSSGITAGTPTQISVQVCESWPEKTLCSPWSGASAAFTAVDTSVSDLRFTGDITAGSWSWSAAPAGSGYSAVEYSCDGDATWTPMAQSGSCAAGASSTFHVRVSTAAGTFAGPVEQWSDFD